MKTIKIIGFILISILALLAVLVIYIKYKSNNIKDNKNLELAIDKLANQFVKDGKSIGMVIGVVKDGKTYIKGYGKQSKENQNAPDSLSVFELASTSKLFTTLTLQILADEGKLSLDDKIQTILNDKVTLPTTAQNTTLRHLATHLSGFPSLPQSFLNKMTDETNPYKDLKTEDIYDYLKNCDSKQEEETFEYSNFGMGLLGHLLELKTNVKYEDLVKQKLLHPLDMKNTFVTIDSITQQKIIQGYDELNNPNPIWKDEVLTGAGSFLSNALDMLKFLKANLNENQSTLSASLIKTHQQQLNGETGLGWILPSSSDKLIGNGNIVWHNGMAGGYASYIAVDKMNNYGIVILSNKAEDVTSLGMKLTRLIRTQSWKE